MSFDAVNLDDQIFEFLLIWNGHHDHSRVEGELTAGLLNLNALSSILAELIVCNLY
jgi:hypothetical protein